MNHTVCAILRVWIFKYLTVLADNGRESEAEKSGRNDQT